MCSMMILTSVTLLLSPPSTLLTVLTNVLSRAPRNLRRCSNRNRSGNNNTTDDGRRHPSSLASGDALSPQEVEIALVESSLRNMMASMSTMMEAQAWGNSLGINMSSGDRREYIANVLMTKVRIQSCCSFRCWRIILVWESTHSNLLRFRLTESCSYATRRDTFGTGPR
jgi:hypothetical protein